MKVLVTGANGFLGSWLCKALCNDGHEVLALVRQKSDVSELSGIPVKFVYGDVTDEPSIVKALDGVDTVFHLAGVVAYKKQDTPLMEKVNVGGTQNVISACEKMKTRMLLHLSSVVAVGAGYHPNEILDEDSKYNIADLKLGYFDTKHDAELLVKKACDENRIHAVMVNPATIYGAGDAKKGSRKNQLGVARGKIPLYPEGGVNVIAVEDVIEGILSAWKRGKNGERYILAGENLTIKEVFDIIAGAAGVPAPRYKFPTFIFFTLGYLGDFLAKLGIKFPVSSDNAWTATMYHWFKNDKAKRELGLNPRPAKFAIENSVRWMKENGYLDK